jgi:hypothetical protein
MFAFTNPEAFSQVLYSSTNATYSQNFNTLGTNVSLAWSNNLTLDGWYALAPSTNPVVISNQTGTSTSSTLANFGSTTTAVNRSIGWVYANSLGDVGTFASIGFGLSNTTGMTLDTFTLSYIGREWRGYSNNTPTLSFQYKIGGTFDNIATNALSGATWTNYIALDFNLPVTNNNARLDGALAPNFTIISNTVSDLAWSNNSVLWIRWRQQNLAGFDAQMAIDEVSFSAVPEPSVYAMLGLAGVALAGYCIRRRRC